MKQIRIGCGQGFWGDWPQGPIDLVSNGNLDYLVLDYLAEVTMSVLVRDYAKDPSRGYARDFITTIGKIGRTISERGIRVVANAGGVNPQSCAEAVLKTLEDLKLPRKLKVGIVEGDNILSDLSALHGSGETLVNLDSGAPFTNVTDRVRSANAYIGCEGIVQCLQSGADIVITGRVADPCLVLGPLVHEYNWSMTDWNKLASGIVAGHIIECGAQATGGNFLGDWRNVPNQAALGYPIVVVDPTGDFTVTKAIGSGGLVSAATVKEQIVYEIGDPSAYITPDVVADFTSFKLDDIGGNEVRITGVKGKPRPEKLKVSMSYADGFTAAGTLLYSWPDAVEKARFAGELVRKRLIDNAKLPEHFNIELVGLNACHGDVSVTRDIDEVMLRVAVRDKDRSVVETFTREMAPLVLNGPPCCTSYFNARGEVKEVVAYWPTLLSRERIRVSSRLF